ncbi:MAG: ABC transporter ATP-binding protein [Parcubacteria group bacterium]
MVAVEVSNLTKYFGKTKAVDGISFSVEPGEVFGFLGPNGAGKTTTIRCMMDFIRPTGGSISLLGLDAQKDSMEIKKRVGYLSGYVRLYGTWTGEDHIRFAQRLSGSSDHADELAKRLNFDPSIKAKALSTGNRQKLGLILSLLNDPELIIMDEPTNALDPLLQNAVYELLDEAKKRGATIFMSSHNLNEVDRICTKVCVIKQGKVVTTSAINDLKKMRMYKVHAHVAGSLLPETFTSLGAEIIEHRNDYVTMKVKGNVTPIIKALGAYELHDLEVEHATLEDIFLEYYES